MSITKNKEQINYQVKVTNARPIEGKDGRYSFNANVNGVNIDGFILQEYVNKDGNEGTMVCMPQRKGKDKDGKDAYYNIVWFPISKELKEDIIRQVGDIINK